MTLTRTEIGSDEERRMRLSIRRQTGRYSSLGTLAALVVVHLVFLVVYGVHSKWIWATELVDALAAYTSVLF